MKTFAALGLALLLSPLPAPPPGPAAPRVQDITVEQIISRENPDFSVDAPLTVGRDGRLYLASGGNHSYVLRFDPTGDTPPADP